MPSKALARWQTVAQRQLDELLDAHRAIGGTGPGRRLATTQVNHAFAVLLQSQFQRYCRDLHSEAVDHLCARLLEDGPEWAEVLARKRLTEQRKLDRGNANPGNLGADFGQFEMSFWNDVYRQDGRNRRRRAKLDALNAWRNAIAHQDFSSDSLVLDATGRLSLQKMDVEMWRSACAGLAVSFDRAVAKHLAQLLGADPW